MGTLLGCMLMIYDERNANLLLSLCTALCSANIDHAVCLLASIFLWLAQQWFSANDNISISISITWLTLADENLKVIRRVTLSSKSHTPNGMAYCMNTELDLTCVQSATNHMLPLTPPPKTIPLWSAKNCATFGPSTIELLAHRQEQWKAGTRKNGNNARPRVTSYWISRSSWSAAQNYIDCLLIRPDKMNPGRHLKTVIELATEQ